MPYRYNPDTPAPIGWRYHTRPRQYSAPSPSTTSFWSTVTGSPDNIAYEGGMLVVEDAASRTLEQVSQLVQRLYAWALTNNIHLEAYNYTVYRPSDAVRVVAAPMAAGRSPSWVSTFYVTPVRDEQAGTDVGNTNADAEGRHHVLRTVQSMRETMHCTCGATMRLDNWTVICPSCHTTRTCAKCGLFTNIARVDGSWYCLTHRRLCDWVLQPTADQPRHRRCGTPIGMPFRYCEEHGNRSTCSSCSAVFEAGETSERFCKKCRLRVCAICNELKAEPEVLQHVEAYNIYMCSPCWAKVTAEYGTHLGDEAFDGAVDLSASALRLETTRQRPIRVCSIEMETVGGGSHLAAALYDAELSPLARVGQYHSDRQLPSAFCWVERDTSIGDTGGELIFNRIELDSKDDVDKLHRGIGILRDLVRDHRIKINTQCGLHIHIDAHQFGIGHVRNLVTIFNYLEDPLYRLSAAKYFRHRGMRFAQKIEKGPYPTDAAFAAFFSRNGHRHGLNVGHYWNAVRNGCTCGNIMLGKYDKCACNLGKCTFEFRIFNGTSNPRKVHAYAAIVQSMTAYARSIPPLREKSLPPFEYFDNTKITHQTKDLWRERLEWMFRNLYFTGDERESIMYVINNCQLKELGNAELRRLENVVYRPSMTMTTVSVPKTALRAAQAGRTAAQVAGSAAPQWLPSEGIAYSDEDDDYYDQ